ncbi:MAG: nucleoside diphosphate kinase regulator [Chloroflexi bacterium]|nr:nucleoside diphosphate kinase regulator [Anaerolineaceae bacterium]NMB90217.1 nucleoside diphosphate kinase regulator [Chloroflexota bacterium]
MDTAISITTADAENLKAMIEKSRYNGYRDSPALGQLIDELERARIIPKEQAPSDLVTMHSRVALLDLDSGEEMVFTLVYPEEGDVASGKITVLAPIGMAMLGYRVGDTFTWQTPDGVCRLRVEHIEYQPEAAGDE